MIERLISESKKQLEDFTAKIANIRVAATAPDLSEVKEVIAVGWQTFVRLWQQIFGDQGNN